MTQQRFRQCPRCGGRFECRSGMIERCQCRAVPLDARQREEIARRYDDCLCAACLAALRNELGPSRPPA